MSAAAEAARAACAYAKTAMGAVRGDSPEFHPGPKGKSQAKTVRMMGDCADSSSSLSAPSCRMGSHACTSASWKKRKEHDVVQDTDPS